MSYLMKALSDKIKGTAKRINSGVADLMSYPSRKASGIRQRRAENEFNVLRRERDERPLPDTDRNGVVTDAYKNRVVADGIRRRHGK